MSFLQRLKMSLARFMQGRHGADNLGMFTLITGLACSLIGSFTGIGLLSLVGFALYIITLFRMFSRNHEKRMAENRKYRYFKCPNCKVLLRMKRGSGEKDITCVRCGYQFKQKS